MSECLICVNLTCVLHPCATPLEFVTGLSEVAVTAEPGDGTSVACRSPSPPCPRPPHVRGSLRSGAITSPVVASSRSSGATACPVPHPISAHTPRAPLPRAAEGRSVPSRLDIPSFPTPVGVAITVPPSCHPSPDAALSTLPSHSVFFASEGPTRRCFRLSPLRISTRFLVPLPPSQ